MTDLPRVVVSVHAIARARERFPAMKGPEKTLARICRDALAAERRSPKQPVWAQTWHRVRYQGSIRYLWDEAETICLVVQRQRIGGCKAWFIITAIRPSDPERLRASRLLSDETRRRGAA